MTLLREMPLGWGEKVMSPLVFWMTRKIINSKIQVLKMLLPSLLDKRLSYPLVFQNQLVVHLEDDDGQRLLLPIIDAVI